MKIKADVHDVRASVESDGDILGNQFRLLAAIQALDDLKQALRRQLDNVLDNVADDELDDDYDYSVNSYLEVKERESNC